MKQIWRTDTGALIETEGMAEFPDGWTMLPGVSGQAAWDQEHAAASAVFAQALAEAEAVEAEQAARRSVLLSRLADLLEADPNDVADLFGIRHTPIGARR